jgi:hypothetical protein
MAADNKFRTTPSQWQAQRAAQFASRLTAVQQFFKHQGIQTSQQPSPDATQLPDGSRVDNVCDTLRRYPIISVATTAPAAEKALKKTQLPDTTTPTKPEKIKATRSQTQKALQKSPKEVKPSIGQLMSLRKKLFLKK